jgi:predicted TPR repeat methyltransferase
VVWLRGKRKTRHFWLQDANTARDAPDWPHAAMAYARRLDLVPGEAAIWIQYGHALKQSGGLDRALPAYERSRLLDPADSDRDIHLTHLRRMIAEAKAAAHAG